MLQIKIRWGDLGSPVDPGTYRCGRRTASRSCRATLTLPKGHPDAVFTAIHPNFYPDAAPYLLTGVDLPPTNPKFERGSGVEEEQALAKKSPDQASTVEKFVSSGRTGARNNHQRRGLLI